MRCKLYRYEKSNFVSSYKLTNQLEVHISGEKKEKHKATNQSKFVMELKSHAIREAPWMIHCRLHVVTKLMHQHLEPKDPRIPARCSIMGPWLEVANEEHQKLNSSLPKSRSCIMNRDCDHPNPNLAAEIEVLATQIEIHWNWDSATKFSYSPSRFTLLPPKSILLLLSVKFRRG